MPKNLLIQKQIENIYCLSNMRNSNTHYTSQHHFFPIQIEEFPYICQYTVVNTYNVFVAAVIQKIYFPFSCLVTYQVFQIHLYY